MAKKNNEVLDSDFDLDSSLDFEDFDFGDPFMKDDRKPITKMAAGFAEGVGDTLRDTAFLKATLKDILPNGYGQTIDLSDQITDSFRSLYDDSAREMRPAIESFKKTAVKLVPKDNRFVPKSVTELLKRWEEEQKSDSKYAPLSKERQREALLSSQMSDIFKSEAEQTAKTRAEDLGRSNLKEGIELNRHRDMFSLANQSAISLKRLEHIALSVNLRVQKKGIELQHRQLFAIQDLIEVTQKDAAKRDQLLTNIVKNTALPEYVKITDSENMRQIAKNKFISAITEGLFGGRNQIVEKTIKGIRDNVLDQVKGLAEGVQMGLSGAEEAASSIPGADGGMGPDRHTLGGSMVGGMATSAAVSKMVAKYRDKLKGSKLDKRFKIFDRGHALSNMHENLAQKANDFRNSRKWDWDDSFSAAGIRMLQSLIPSLSPQTALTTVGVKDMTKPYAYTLRTDKSINEVIPGYLARILREVQVLRTGNNKTELTEFDFDKSSFIAKSASEKKLLDSVVPQAAVKATQERLNKLVDEIQGTGTTLSPAAREALKAKLLKNSAATREGNAKNLAQHSGYNDLDDGTRSELLPVMKEFFKNLTPEQRLQFSQKYNDLTNGITDTRASIQHNVNLGRTGSLENMGFVTPDGKNIDLNAIYQRYLLGVPGAAGGPADGAAGGAGGGAGGGLPPFGPGSGGLPPFGPGGPGGPGTPPNGGSGGGSGGNGNGGGGGLPGLPNWRFLPNTGTPGWGPSPGFGPRAGTPGAGPSPQGTARTDLNALGSGELTPEEQEEAALVNPTNRLLSDILNTLNVTRAVTLGALDTEVIGSGAGSSFRFKKLAETQFEISRFDAQYVRFSKKKDELQKRAVAVAKRVGKAVPLMPPSAGLLSLLNNNNPSAGLGAQTLDQSTPLMEQTLDVYVKGEKAPRMRAVKLLQGLYRDRKSGKAIFRPSEVKGEVVDEKGNVVVSEEELPGLVLFDTHKNTVSSLPVAELRGSIVTSHLRPQNASSVQALAKQSLSLIDNVRAVVINNTKDVYVRGEASPRILAVKLRQGLYRLRESGQVITDQSEINGEVIDQQGAVVITSDELSNVVVYNEQSKQYERPSAMGTLSGAVDKQYALLRGKVTDKLTLANLRIGFDKASKAASEVLSPAKDVFVVGSSTPRLIAAKLRAGEYYLAETGKSIFHQDDITGEVRDRATGDVQIAMEEIPNLAVFDNDAGAMRLIGRGLKGFAKMLWKFQTQTAPKMAANNLRRVWTVTKWVGTGLLRTVGLLRSKPKDVYVGREREPRLYAARLKAGQYRLRESSVIIYHHEDIRGPVEDLDGEIKISEDDIEHLRVYDSVLKVFNPFKLLCWVVKSAAKLAWKFQTKVAPKMVGAIVRTMGKVAGKLVSLLTKPANVYTKGASKPLLSERVMREGGYFSANTRSVIANPSEIDGPVLNEHGKEVLTEDDIQAGLVDDTGNPIRSSLLGKVGKMFKGAGKLFSLRVKLKALPGTGQHHALEVRKENAQHKTVELLQDIKDIFKQHFGKTKVLGDSDGDGVREGSYRDKQNKRKNAKGVDLSKVKTAKEAAAKGAGGLGLGGLTEMLLGNKGMMAAAAGWVAKTIGFVKTMGPLTFSALGYGLGKAGEKMGVGGNTLNEKADDDNWSKMSGLEKLQSGLGRGIEKIGSFVFLDSFANEAASNRIKAETDYFKKKETAEKAVGGDKDLAGYLANPSLLGSAVNLYKGISSAMSRKLSVLDKVRYVQYGFFADKEEHAEKIFALEDYMLGFVKESDTGLTIDEKEAKIKTMVSPFGLDFKNENHLSLFFGWYQKRFKPVYLTHLTALRGIASQKDLKEVNSLKGDKRRAYIEAVQFKGGPYSFNKLPLVGTDVPRASTITDVDAAVAAVLKGLPDNKEAVAAKANDPAATPAAHSSAKGMVEKVAGFFGLKAFGLFGQDKETIPDASVNVASSVSRATVTSAARVSAVDAVRYKTYGLAELEASKVRALRLTEKLVAEKVRYDANCVATWTANPLGVLNALMGSYGISSLLGAEAESWVKWFRRRFLPVYMAYLSAFRAYTGKENASEGPGILKSFQQLELARILADISGCWSESDTPWPGYRLGNDSDVVKPNIELLESATKEEVLAEEKRTTAKQPTGAQAAQAKKTPDRLLGDTPTSAVQDKTLPGYASPDAESKPAASPASRSSGESVSATPAPMASGGVLDGRGGMQYVNLVKGARLEGVHPAILKNFLGMAEEYGKATGKKINVNDGFRTYEEQADLHRRKPQNAAPAGSSIHEKGLAIDIDGVTLNEMDKLGLMRKYGFTRPIGGENWHMEPAGIQGDINKYRNNRDLATVAIEAGVGRGGAGYGSIVGTPKLRRNTEMAVKLLSMAPAPNVNNKLASPPLPTPMGDKLGAPASASSASAPTSSAILPTAFKGASSGMAAAGAGVGGDSESKPASASPGGLSTRASALPADPGVKIPDAKGSGYTAMKGVIEAAAKMVGVDSTLMLKTAAVESSFDPNAKAKGGTASGLFQFTDDTWKEVLKTHGNKYGYKYGTTSPFDIKANAIMGAHYLKDTAKVLGNATSRVIGATESYIGHFMGPSGGSRFLKLFESAPDALGARMFPDAAASNKPIFYEGTRPRTIAEIYAIHDNKVRNKLSTFGLSHDGVASTTVASKTSPSQASAGYTQVSAAPMVPGQGNTPSATTPAARAPAKPKVTASVTQLEGSPLADAYGFKPTQAAVNERSSQQPSSLNKELFSTTEGLLTQSVEVQKNILNVLTSIFGFVSQKAPEAPAVNPTKPSEPYVVPKVSVPMRRVQT